MSEIELKFLLDETSSRELLARLKALKLASGPPKSRTLRSIYLDTPEHALKKAGIALRLRREGRRWIQTVKTKGAIHGGLSQVGEVECPAPGGRVRLEAIPDASIREEVLRQVNGAQLLPVCETVIKRAASELSLEDGTRAELAIDVGQIRAEGRSAELREAEIELLEGSPTGLFDIARKLFPEGGLQFSRLSKSARGYLLAEEGQIEPPLAPQNARAIAVDPAQIAEHAARDVLRDCLDQIATNFVVVRKLDDIEGPHQLRIGLRRLRSAFSVYKSALESPEMGRLNGEAKWLGQEVGRLRDLDVVANEIVGREAALHPDEAGLSALAEALLRQAGEQPRSGPHSADRGPCASVPHRPGAVRRNAGLAGSGRFRADGTAGGTSGRFGASRAEQALEEGRQSGPASRNADCRTATRFAKGTEEAALRRRIFRTAVSVKARRPLPEGPQKTADRLR